MRPHPRIRKTVKWGGAVVSFVLFLAWAGSGMGFIDLYTSGDTAWTLGEGCISRSVIPDREYVGIAHRGWRGFRDARITWMPGTAQTKAYAARWIPLWPLLGVTVAGTVTAWRLDTLARRRAKLGACPKCNYSRTGLAADAVCPECGSLPSNEPSAAR